jgi:hypothetical protein
MTGLNLYSSNDYAVPPPTAPQIAQPVQPTAQPTTVAPLVLPPMNEPVSLSQWPEPVAVIKDATMTVRLSESSSDAELVLNLSVKGAEPGDRDHGAFYQAVAIHVWHHCPKAEIRSADGQMAIARDAQTSALIDKAVQQVSTLSPLCR